MKRLQIMIQEELDTELGRRARAEGVSKAELIRRYVGEKIQPLPPIEQDPIWDLVGDLDIEPVPVHEIDDVIYGTDAAE